MHFLIIHVSFGMSFSPEKAAPILCAGVTTYSGIKATEARPGQFLTVIGAAGGLGHLAVQFGVAMGLRVLALDCGEDKLKFCTDTLGAEAAFEAMDPEVAAHVRRREGGGEARDAATILFHILLTISPYVFYFPWNQTDPVTHRTPLIPPLLPSLVASLR